MCVCAQCVSVCALVELVLCRGPPCLPLLLISHTFAHTHTHTHTHFIKRTQTHAGMHTHTYMHTYTHTDTQTNALSLTHPPPPTPPSPPVFLASASTADDSNRNPFYCVTTVMSFHNPSLSAHLSWARSFHFFFREVALEYTNCGKKIYSRLVRICKVRRSVSPAFSAVKHPLGRLSDWNCQNFIFRNRNLSLKK